MNTKSILERADNALANYVIEGMESHATISLIRDMRDYIAGMGWQDISTAPKDGRPVLISYPIAKDYRGDTNRVASVHWSDHRWYVMGGVIIGSEIPTHWRPLPSKPENNDGR